MGHWTEPPSSLPSCQCSGTPCDRWLGGVGGSLAAVPTLFPGARPLFFCQEREDGQCIWKFWDSGCY